MQGEEWLPKEDGRPVWDRTKALRAGVARGQAGQAYKSNLEDLLKSMLPQCADEHLMTNQEGRGAFLALLVPDAGPALFLGDSLSGTVSALARSGFEVTVGDFDPARLAFAKLRDDAYAPGRVQHVQVEKGGPFPFKSHRFSLVVAELGPRGEEPLWGNSPRDLFSLTHDTLVWVADNALAYKQALGQRGRFEYTAPWTWIRRGLRPKGGTGTRRSLAKQMEPHFPQVESLALYPHRLECSHVVALDRPTPRLTLGPKERRNHIKMLGHRLGIFPWLTPSFAWIARVPKSEETNRIERVLEDLREQIGGAQQICEHLIATRGNVMVVQTLGSEASPAWTLHIPLCPQKHRLVERHYRCLGHIRTTHPEVLVPKPLFHGQLQGLQVTCEERLPGLSAPQLAPDGAEQQRMLLEVSQWLPNLAVGERRALDEEHLESLLGERIRRVLRLCGKRDTGRRILRMWHQAKERMLGLEYQPTLYHADLRPKHVQVDSDGRPLGLLDWGAYEEAFLPFVDLLHLIAHRRPASARLQWQRIVQGRIADWEQSLLDGYCQTLEIHPDLRVALEHLYPVLVAGMAERNWDFSRPYWVHREFGL